MKFKIVFLFLTLFMTQLSYSQGGMGGGRPGGQGESGEQGMDMSQINFEESAGIIQYDLDKVYRKIKLKDKDAKEQADKAFWSYENALRSLSFTQSTSLNFLKEATSLIKIYKENRDMDKMKGLMQEVKKHTMIME